MMTKEEKIEYLEHLKDAQKKLYEATSRIREISNFIQNSTSVSEIVICKTPVSFDVQELENKANNSEKIIGCALHDEIIRIEKSLFEEEHI